MPVPMLTETELANRALALSDPNHDCDQCSPPGVCAPMYPNNDTNHLFIQRCDNCQFVDDDNDAAQVIADALGLVVHVRYDDEHLEYFRPFVTLAGAADDADFYCVDADEFGCNPHEEVRIERPSEPITPEQIVAAHRRLKRIEQHLS